MLCFGNAPQNRLSNEFVVLSPTKKYVSAEILYGYETAGCGERETLAT